MSCREAEEGQGEDKAPKLCLLLQHAWLLHPFQTTVSSIHSSSHVNT